MKPRIALIWRSDLWTAMNAVSPIIAACHRYGILVDVIDMLRINTATGLIDNSADVENQYIGAILGRPTEGYQNYTAFLSVAHPWPVLTWDSYPISDSAPFLCGQTGNASNNGTSWRVLDTPYGSVQVRKYAYGAKSADWAANIVTLLDGTVIDGGGDVEYTELIIDNTEAGGRPPNSIVAWRRNDPDGADVLYNNASSDAGECLISFMCLCYYLDRMVGYVPPKPIRLLIDLDDIDSATGSAGTPGVPVGTLNHCLAEFADWLRANNTISVVGINRQPTDTEAYNEPVIAIDNDANAIISVMKANLDVYKPIIHDHDFNLLYFADDTIAEPAPQHGGIEVDTTTLEGKLAIAALDLAQCRAAWGDEVDFHYKGYFYLPNNALSPLGAALASRLGCRIWRSGPHSDASKPYAVAGRGIGRVKANTVTGMVDDIELTTYSTEGGYGEVTWAQFAGASNATAASRVFYIINGWIQRGVEIMMSHGSNYAIDPIIGEAPIEKWLREFVMPAMQFCGSNFWRFMLDEEVGQV